MRPKLALLVAVVPLVAPVIAADSSPKLINPGTDVSQVIATCESTKPSEEMAAIHCLGTINGLVGGLRLGDRLVQLQSDPNATPRDRLVCQNPTADEAIAALKVALSKNWIEADLPVGWALGVALTELYPCK
jgi:hypothetical protein